MLVSGRPGPFRAELISDQAALGTAQDGVGCSGTGPKTAWDISGGSESSRVHDQLGPENARAGPRPTPLKKIKFSAKFGFLKYPEITTTIPEKLKKENEFGFILIV